MALGKARVHAHRMDAAIVRFYFELAVPLKSESPCSRCIADTAGLPVHCTVTTLLACEMFA